MSALSASAGGACPHTMLDFGLSASEIGERAASLVGGLEATVEAIARGEVSDPCGAWTAATDAVAVGSAEVCLPALVATDRDAREAGAAAKRALIGAFQRADGRREVYGALRAAERGGAVRGDATRAAALRKQLSLFEANGLALEDESAREEVARVKAELGLLCAAFEQCINVDEGVVTFAAADLEGLPAAAVAKLPSRDGGQTRDVGLKAPTLQPVLQLCAKAETRKRAMAAGQSKCPENVARLDRIVYLRSRPATGADVDRRFGGCGGPNFKALHLRRIEVVSADSWTTGPPSSRSPSLDQVR